MHQAIKLLSKVADRYLPSRMLSFNIAHIFKTMQLISEQSRVSRMILVDELGLGEGSIKTLVRHLKMYGLVETSKGGMRLSQKGMNLYFKLATAIPRELSVPKCSIVIGRFNHAILLKGLGSEINSGIEQRDFAIFMGAHGATTLLHENKRFIMPGQTHDTLKGEKSVKKLILEGLLPQDSDLIIISSADDERTADLAAKYAALMTVVNHHKRLQFQ